MAPRLDVGAADRAELEVKLDGPFRLVLVLAAICGVFAAVMLLIDPGSAGPSRGIGATATRAPSPSPTTDVSAYLYPTIREAPSLDLVDPDARPFALTSLRGDLVFVFFGYTHCPDVCPATIGTVGQAMATYGAGVRAVFVSVDPERDTTTWLKEYAQYMPTGFTPLTGTAEQVRTAAVGWGVKYARVEADIPGAYSMSHTADVFLVDPAGRLRARFPFGTSAMAMTATLDAIKSPLSDSSAPAPASLPSTPGVQPSAAATTLTTAMGQLRVEAVSSSIWAGRRSPVILALYGPAGRLNDVSIRPTVRLTTKDGVPLGNPVDAVPVRPPGVDTVSYVALIDVPAPGWWGIAVSATPGALTLGGSTDIAALDPGTSAPIGSAAPTIRTPTLDDVSGEARLLSTDPIPDLRLYRTSTSDALAQHRPFVLVLDSTKFRVTTACGKALVMARYLQDRWPDVTFIHHEPFRYTVVTDTPVLEGTLAEPHLADVANAWGIGGDPWGPSSMPWIFVVDGNGTVRAKYQGVMGSDDVDVIVALIVQGD